jgi:acyl-coenzyme A thioesterase PaaI-like protein
MNSKAIQDLYPEDYSHCYGCGRLNENGLQIKTYWDGKEGTCTFIPDKDQISMHGFAYGGLIASLIDCNGTATAVAAAYEQEGREQGSEPVIRYVTASLHVDYIRPTPADCPMEIKSHVKEIGSRRIIISTELSAGGMLCAKGEVTAARIPPSMKQQD